ncbi:MAG: hypothetical protein L0212_10900, partial [Acidobacteria bacterium]|nr:hypothetical protein [Acidobacteriota bacterium]
RDIQPYPRFFSGEPASSLPERWQWTFPIVVPTPSARATPTTTQSGTNSIDRRGAARCGAIAARVSADLIKGQLIWVTEADSNRKAQARVVFAVASQTPGKRAVAFELLGEEDFWGTEFPPAHAPTPVSRRRSGRVEHGYEVVLVWKDEWGRTREDPAQTRILSDYGAEVVAPIALPVGSRLRLRVPRLDREADAQVISARAGEQPGRVELGLELVGVEDFWDVDIPPEAGDA